MGKTKLMLISLVFAAVGCKDKNQDVVEKAKNAFVEECNTAARANPGAEKIDFTSYCDCAWEKLMNDKKFEDIILKGEDKSPEAMEYSKKKIADPEFQKDLESCKDEIKI